MLFSAKVMAILHLSVEKGTEKRALKIATVFSVLCGQLAARGPLSGREAAE